MKKKANKNTTIKVSTKSLNEVAKGVAKEVTTAGRELKKERKSLKATIRFLLSSETPEGKMFRDFFGLNARANKQACKDVMMYIQAHYARAIEVYTLKCTSDCESDEVAPVLVKLLPATLSGREKTDYIDVISDIVKVELVNRPKRLELGRQIKHLWTLCKEEDKMRYATALKNTFAPKLAKYTVTTQIVGKVTI